MLSPDCVAVTVTGPALVNVIITFVPFLEVYPAPEAEMLTGSPEDAAGTRNGNEAMPFVLEEITTRGGMVCGAFATVKVVETLVGK